MSLVFGNHRFEGPVKLVEWAGECPGGVFAILHLTLTGTYGLAFVGEHGKPFRRSDLEGHEKSKDWIKKAGGEGGAFVAVLSTGKKSEAARRAIVKELVEEFAPPCNSPAARKASKGELNKPSVPRTIPKGLPRQPGKPTKPEKRR